MILSCFTCKSWVLNLQCSIKRILNAVIWTATPSYFKNITEKFLYIKTKRAHVNLRITKKKKLIKKVVVRKRLYTRIRASHVKIKMAVNYSCLSISCLYSYSYSNKKAKVTICS